MICDTTAFKGLRPSAPPTSSPAAHGLSVPESGAQRLTDCVSGLQVLHIRPGAALLRGTAVSGPCPGLPVVARLEWGRPQQLLAPRLLAAAAGPAAGSPPHPNVVRTLGVHLVALPPDDAEDAVGSPAPAAVAAVGVSAGVEETGGPSIRPQLPPSLSQRALQHPLPRQASVTAPLLPACLDRRHADALTVSTALRQAEVLRGALSNTGCIATLASGASSSGYVGLASGLSVGQVMSFGPGSRRLLGCLAPPGPPSRLREVVGGLREPHRTPGSAPPRSELAGPPAVMAAAGDLLGVGGEEGAEDVTLTLTELVDGGCLRDEAARGAFACALPGAAPPPAPALRGEAGEAQAQAQAHPGPGVLPAALRDASLLSRAERLLDTALDVACGLQHLHADMGLAHGDLVSRNVLLQRAAPGDGGQPYTAKLAGYGRLTAPPPPPEEPEPLPTAGSGGLSGNVAGGGGGGGAGSALRSSILCAGGSTPGTGSGYARVSATSVNRVNTVHVGLWRDVASLAPERLNDSTAPASYAADVYAYGVLLYEMAYGEQPWAELTPASVVVGTATGELRLNCPQPLALPGISALLAACTSPSPELRPSAAALVDCVRGLREQLRAAKEAAAERQQQKQSNRLLSTFMDSKSSAGLDFLDMS
ncbi:hypothetical protein HYH03_009190 [Edaphochlamys debaryana]|uniref:Protein kinase domain-containing protein n=1 Tax=Edaphochlamys debaryana TaxID=47281 RepID=A0A835XYX2_9CHLO|nr:hypothetical protein HYH03_009190 [Edaphochlamys debaryana]|eukprot:KAG2492525.1 hypothetical protein HYH03_009190 [Edaphochlamys debaryana]